MKNRYDIVIIGGGCIGTAVASYLGDSGCCDVLVLEKEKMLGTGATAKCAGGVRAQFTTPINIQMSHYSIRQFAVLEKEYGIQYTPCGYLFVIRTEEQKQRFLKNMEFQRSFGVEVRWVETDTIAELAPNYSLHQVLGGTFGPNDGLIDPSMTVDAFYKRARKHKIEFETETPCIGLKTFDGKVTHVITPKGEIACDTVINCAGPQSKLIGEMIDLKIPIEPIRRILTTTGELKFVTRKFPMVVDVTTGVYMHPEGNGLLIGYANPEEPPGFDETINEDVLERMLTMALELMPALEEAEIKMKYPGTWGGLYETTPDHHSIIGYVPGWKNFMIVGGFSGHGLMHCPAAGLAAAEIIVHGRCESFDLHPLRFSRFAEGDLTEEVNVI